MRDPLILAHDIGTSGTKSALVRPDGVVAWRRPDDAPERNACLADAFRRAACLHG